MRILLVEDDYVIGDGIKQGLEAHNYAVDWVQTKKFADAALATTQYELLILDLGLPDGSGLDILSSLRDEKHDDTPVLILTAYDHVSFKINGLDSGADDYIVKPFDLDELAARVRALRRRAGGRGSPLLTVGDIVLDPKKMKVEYQGKTISLGTKEFAILHTLMEKPGRILSKEQIETSLYGWNMEIESNTIEVHVHGIRKKMSKDVIKNIRHVGYRIGP
jgi:two-component system response regulator QseB